MADRPDIGLAPAVGGRWILVMVATYLVLHHLQAEALGPEWLRYYGKDILLVPMLLTASEVCLQLAGRNRTPGIRETLLAVVYTSVFFEWIWPGLRGMPMGDVLDIVAYAAGGIIFLTLTRPNRSSKHQDKSQQD